MKIGVISDTHNFLDDRVASIFKGVDHILHAGDIGLPNILRELEQIAPVTSVSGNTDDPSFQFAETAVVQLLDRKFLVHHIVAPHHLHESLKEKITRAQADVVVFGHTHKPFCEQIGGVLFFNPGYAGKSRFGMERSVAILHGEKAELRPQYITL